MLLYLWMMVQIICESLPISSSGHVALVQKILGSTSVLNQELWAFDYLLQGVSAIIFLIYFFPYWWQLIIGKPIRISSLLDSIVWKKNIFPVFVFGFVADGMTFLLWSCDIANRVSWSLAFGFMITAVVLWSIQYMHQDKNLNYWSWKNAVIVGLMQGVALLPGISRFGITIATLQWLGYSGRIAFSISFLLQWPLIVLGAIKGFCSLQDPLVLQTVWSMPFLMVMFASGCAGYGLLYCVGKIIDKKLLWKFSYYMIAPICLSLFFMA